MFKGPSKQGVSSFVSSAKYVICTSCGNVYNFRNYAIIKLY